MTKISQGNKKITTRKIPATNNEILVRTGSLRFFKKYLQPIIKFWFVPVPLRETVRFLDLYCFKSIFLHPFHFANLSHRERFFGNGQLTALRVFEYLFSRRSQR